MKISRSELESAVSKGIISSAQADKLWNAFQSDVRASFELAHIAYYLGALVVIAAMAWLMTNGWDRFGGAGIAVLSVTYATCFSLVGWYLWNTLDLKIPGGLLYTMAVCMTPLAIYGVERATGFWTQGYAGVYHDYYQLVKGGWFLMEIGTIVVGLIALRFVAFPFLTAPIAPALWFMSMDLTPILFGRSDFTFHDRLWVSLVVGLIILIIGYIVDRRTKEDYSFWLYLFGLLAFWGGLSLMDSQNEWSKLVYCFINIALMVVSIFLDRPMFIIFGAIGFFGYLEHLSQEVFKNSMMFPFALTILGLSIIYLGVKYQRNRGSIEALVVSIIPPNLKWLIPKERLSR